MLKAHGDYILPTNVPANQFLNFEGRKFSKSKGWGIEMHQYLEEFKDFPNKEDALRYTLIRNMPETKDADFKWDEFTEFHDNELVANLGNFINRVIVLTNKYYDGVVPEAIDNETAATALTSVKTVIEELCSELDKYNFRNAILKLMELSSIGNTYLQDVSPWKIWKTEPDSQVVKNCIHNCIQIVGFLSVVCEPFLPFSSEKIRSLLNLPKVENGDLTKVLDLFQTQQSLIPAGHQIGEPALLFAKINDRKDTSRKELIEQQKANLQAILDAEVPAHEPVKDTASFEDFTKLDIRTGTIIEAEKIKKTKKLLKLTIDIGFENRTIVSGLAEHYKPEDLVGQEVVLLVNLAPRKLKGVESQGMVLTAENTKGELCLISPKEVFGNGFVVK